MADSKTAAAASPGGAGGDGGRGEPSTPPPSYEEALGQFLTSVTRTPELPALSYIDMMPRLLDPGNMQRGVAPVFETFSDLMYGTNLWLQRNPGLRVWKCETVERKLETGPVVHLDNTIHHESSYGANYYVSGIRFWLTRRLDPEEPVQQLELLHVPPPVQEVALALVTRGMPGLRNGGGLVLTLPVMRFRAELGGVAVAMGAEGTFLTYQGLSKALDRLNDVLRAQPLPGSILNVETVSVKFGDGCSETEADPDVTSWCEKGKGSQTFSFRRVTKILRVFYVRSQPRSETLKMMTVLPRVTQQPEWNKGAVFEPFDEIVLRAQQWLQTLEKVRIVGIETRDTEYKSAFGQPVTFSEDSTDEIITRFLDRNMAQYLRIFYVTDTAAASYASTLLTSRVFVPACLGGRRFETINETLNRINSWLQFNAGLPVFSVETVPYLLTASNSVNINKVGYKHSAMVGNYWLTCFRLYFPRTFYEPVPLAMPVNNSTVTSSACHIL